MSENEQENTIPEKTTKRPPLYSRRMIGVLIVFAVCEVLLFTWGHNSSGPTDAAFYAFVGLLFAIAFWLMRYFQVVGDKGSRNVLFCGFLVVFLSIILYPGCSDPRAYCHRSCCYSTLQQLGLALHNYADKYKSFPPAFVSDESGQPMHSWRTLLLPFMEKNELYQKYDFQKPWDSPENQKVASESQLEIMQCLSHRDLPDRMKHRTDYVAVVGKDTLWPADGTSRSFREITAGTHNTAILIELNHSDISWHEPRDIALDELLSGKVPWKETQVHPVLWLYGRSVFYEPECGGIILFADGSTRFVQDNLTPDQIRRLFSITEPFDVDTELSTTGPHPIFFRFVVFRVWLATLFLQLIYVFFPVKGKAN